MMQIVPMTAAYAAEIVTWRYPAPYDIYDMSDEDAAALTGADGGFFALTGQHELIGFRSFGADGQVPGGTTTPPPSIWEAACDRTSPGEGWAAKRSRPAWLSARSC
jgi:hypothetical protein